MPKRTCLFCRRRAALRGRVACRDCGLESGPEEYREQIEQWQETACAIAFGAPPKGDTEPPPPANGTETDRPTCAGKDADP